jgi:hypothetical protein
MFWTGGQFALHSPSKIYDSAALTAAQTWVRNTHAGPLPFIYPPTALLLIAPFALIGLWVSYYMWVAVSLGLFWAAGRRIVGGWAAAIALVSPHVIIVAVLGQTTLIVGSAVLWSLSLLRSRPFLGGVLMGVAAAIKPQSAILAPFVFVADRNWPALIGALVAGCSLATVSLIFGPARWIEWAADLGSFADVITHWKLDSYGATPFMAARSFGLNPLPFYIVGAALGLLVAIRGVRSDDLRTRVLTFVIGTLFVSPYAMRYELATAAPVLVSALLPGTLRGLFIGAPLFALKVWAIPPALLISAAAALWKRSMSTDADKVAPKVPDDEPLSDSAPSVTA